MYGLLVVQLQVGISNYSGFSEFSCLILEGEQAHCASLCQAMGDGEKSGLAIASLKATDLS